MRKPTKEEMDDFRKQYDEAAKLDQKEFVQEFAEILGKFLSTTMSEEKKENTKTNK